MEKERNNKQLKEGRIDIVNLIDGVSAGVTDTVCGKQETQTVSEGP
jgi:hypothetical protein